MQNKKSAKAVFIFIAEAYSILFKYVRTLPHTDGFRRNNVTYLKTKKLFYSRYLCVTVLFTIKILTSYKIHIGRATSERVKTSEVGVMIAATMRIITTACFR